MKTTATIMTTSPKAGTAGMVKMTNTNRTTAHKELTSKHQTMRWTTDLGMLSIRKTNGRFTVRLEDFSTSKVTTTTYATLPGAMVAADNLRSYFL